MCRWPGSAARSRDPATALGAGSAATDITTASRTATSRSRLRAAPGEQLLPLCAPAVQVTVSFDTTLRADLQRGDGAPRQRNARM